MASHYITGKKQMKYILEVESDENDDKSLWIYSLDDDGAQAHGTMLAGTSAENSDTTTLASFEITPDDIFNAIGTLGGIEQLAQSIIHNSDSKV